MGAVEVYAHYCALSGIGVGDVGSLGKGGEGLVDSITGGYVGIGDVV